MKTIHFPGLNGIRAIAAFIVIFSHIDFALEYFGLPRLGYGNHEIGHCGVRLFFVLSGFLITYLLLQEKNKFNKVDVQKFYIRRILRIWPLYYFLIAICILLIMIGAMSSDGAPVFSTFLFYIFFLPNVGNTLGYTFSVIRPLWSIGVEEQFYGFWPWIISKSTHVFRSIVLFLLFYLIIKIALRFFENSTLYSLMGYTSFDSMAIGGIAAFGVFSKSTLLKITYNKFVQAAAWFFFAYSILVYPIHITSLFDSEIHSLVYAILIVNVSSNIKSIIKLENKAFTFLGKISYGLYIYHSLILFFSAWFLNGVMPLFESMFLNYMTVYALVIIATIVISWLSYTYFESYFLTKKHKFSKIISEPNRLYATDK